MLKLYHSHSSHLVVFPKNLLSHQSNPVISQASKHRLDYNIYMSTRGIFWGKPFDSALAN